MEQSQTIEQIKHVLAEVCEVDQSSIQPGGKLLGYGVDSLRMVDLILSLRRCSTSRSTKPIRGTSPTT